MRYVVVNLVSFKELYSTDDYDEALDLSKRVRFIEASRVCGVYEVLVSGDRVLRDLRINGSARDLFEV